MSKDWQILGIDHIAIPVENYEGWKRVYLDLFGGELFHETLDASPTGASSMKLCGIKIGGLSIALISGIDRKEKSQVSKFVEKHGDHGFQHVAVRVDNLEAFVRWGRENGLQFLGQILQRKDNFGQIKQIFAKKFDPNLNVDEAPFYEFVERPKEGEIFEDIAADSFSDEFAQELYREVEDAGHGVFIDVARIMQK